MALGGVDGVGMELNREDIDPPWREEDRLDKFERKFYEGFMGQNWTEINGELGTMREYMYRDIKVTLFINIQRLQWAGHLARMDENRIPMRIFLQRLYDKRRRGTPKMGWEKAVGEDAERLLKVKSWKTKAKDRNFWRRCINEAKTRVEL
ncbi:hypothetical protein C0J52_00690 [Blattella germanica]|nr:hypothetical protein C0J52_00690 [Blattella germanica]